MAVSSTSSGSLKTGVCLSTDRPDNPYNGQVIYETDTNRTLIYDNSAWVVISDPSLLSYSGTGATVTADAMTVAGENVTPYTGRRNLVHNGAMNVAQRGTSVAGITFGGYLTADRWTTLVGGLGTWTQSIENDAPTGSGFRKSLKMLCTTADASPDASDWCVVQQIFEGQDCQHIKKGTPNAEQLTLSFWVKSNVTGTYNACVLDNDNLRICSASYTVSASSTWEKKTIAFPADTAGVLNDDNGVSFRVQFMLGAGTDWTSGTLNTTWASTVSANRGVGQTNLAAAINNYWQITGVQLELGDKATPFEHRSYGEELALCQRYYQRNLADSDDAFASGVMYTSSIAILSYSFPKMRTAPTITFVGSGDIVTGGSVTGVSSSVTAASETQLSTTQLGVTTSGLTAGHGVVLRWDTNYFELSADL